MENMRQRVTIYMRVICIRNIINKQLELCNNNNYWSGDVYFVIDVDWPFSAGSPCTHTYENSTRTNVFNYPRDFD